MSITYLSPKDLEIICKELQDYFRELKEPPPDYSQSYFDKVESIIAIPKKTFGGQELYSTIYEKAACYMYFINKFHPFNNGNKRLSIVATYVFLKLNNIELMINGDEMYTFTKKVANSHKKQEGEFKEVVGFIKRHTISATFLMRIMSLIGLR